MTFVVHDWGSALGFDWANRHRNAVKSIAYMEAIVQTLAWDAWPERSRGLFQAMRSRAGEEIVLTKNVFVERILPGSVLGGLSEADMGVYRRPYLEEGESRRPTLTWPREIPIDVGTIGRCTEIVSGRTAEWLALSAMFPSCGDQQPSRARS